MSFWKTNKKFYKIAAFALLFIFCFTIFSQVAIAANDVIGDHIAKDAPTVGSKCAGWTGVDLGACILIAISWVLSWIQWLFLFVLQIAVWFFEFSISQSIDALKTYADSDGVMVAWRTIRDVTNMLFLMIMMYIAIGTVLQLEGVNWKKQIGAIIMAAVLINFSMTITRVVVDATNVFALYFYEQAKGGENGPGIPRLLFDKINLDQIVANKDQATANQASTQVPSALSMVVQLIASIILIFATSYVLFLAGFLFIVRLIIIIFSLIMSPLPWIGMAVPKFGGQISGKYWETLISQSLFAPVYMFCIYFVMKFITCIDMGAITNATGGGYLFAGALSSLMFYVIAISLMFSTVLVAKKMGAEGMGFAQSGAKWMMGATVGATAAAGAFAGRKLGQGIATADQRLTGGRGASIAGAGIGYLQSGSKWIKETAPVKAALESDLGKSATVKAGMAYDAAKGVAKAPISTMGGIIKSGTGIEIMPSASDQKAKEKAEKEFKAKQELAAKKDRVIEISKTTDAQIAEAAQKEGKTAEDKKRELDKEIQNLLENFRGDKIMDIGLKNLKANNGRIASWMNEAQIKAVENNEEAKPEDIKNIQDAIFNNPINVRGRRAVEIPVVTRNWSEWNSEQRKGAIKTMGSRNVADLSDSILGSDEVGLVIDKEDVKELRKAGRREVADILNSKLENKVKSKPGNLAQALGGEGEGI